MLLNFKVFKNTLFAIIFVAFGTFGFAQGNTSTIKAHIALGVNSPSSGGFVTNFEGKSINLPTVNLGVQYMFKQKFGAKLDFGFNRISNVNNTPEFKLNYSRINIQAVYDVSQIVNVSQQVGIFPHAGLGYSMIKPLGNFPQNKTSFLNAMGGMEFHYGISDKLSLYLDASYILGLSKDFDPVFDGFGSFNGNLLTVTIGVSISLSGCYYCEQND